MVKKNLSIVSPLAAYCNSERSSGACENPRTPSIASRLAAGSSVTRFNPTTRSTASRLAAGSSVTRFNPASGFTLIELMIVVMIIAIIAAIAIPSYQAYVRRAEASQAVQGAQQIAALLERHKARNFGYQGFNLTTAGVVAPRTYSFDLKDGADTARTLNDSADPPVSGRTWALKGITDNPQNYNFLMTSTGIRCKNKTAANVSYTSCGVGSEPW